MLHVEAVAGVSNGMLNVKIVDGVTRACSL